MWEQRSRGARLALALPFGAAGASSSETVATLRAVVLELPTDPAALVTLSFFLASLALVAWYGRPGGRGGRGGTSA